jgi:type IV pilus assembly protein PilQ
VEPSPEVIPAGNGSDAWKLEVTPEGDDALSIQITNADFREVLAQLSEQGGLNLLATKSATAKISASLVAVDVETALDAILKSAGYVARRDGAFIYVGPPADFKELEQAWDQIGTRVYRPNYVTALEIQTLITPLLSPNVGKSSVTTASDEGIGADSATAGGESYANGAAVVVQDYERVLALVDELVAEVDVRPMQVSIEAMILSVRLDDTHRFGINFQLFRDKDHLIVSSGSPLASLTDLALDGGLKLAFLDSSLSAFLEALETVGDTNVIATPSLMCLNKQRAEILIGAQLGYISTTLTETSTAQNVEFLEVGAALRLRPFISRDGLIRLEVHPELSTGNVRVEGGFTLPDKELTQVTTNIMVRDGCTVVIGGLMREDLSTSTTQIPYLGSLPVVGGLFRQRDQTLERREILILVTPSIVYEPEVCMEGEAGAAAFHHRQAVKADSMSPLATRYLSRKNLRLAEEYAAAGRVEMARRRAELAVHYDPNNLAAIQFRDSLGPGGSTRTAIGPPLMPPTEGDALDGDTISPWILDELEGQSGMPEAAFPHPRDPGLTGRVRSVGPAPWGSQRLGLEGEGAGP